MLTVLKRLWAAIKAPRRADSNAFMVWRHGYGWRYNGSRYGARRGHTVQQVRGPKNSWGATRGSGF